MAEPKATISPKLLFIKNGKLTRHPASLTGTLHLKDNTNIATIMGKFKNGICSSADIYRNQKNKISNIQIQIHEDGSIKMGGSKVKEQKQRIMYEGGYSGYCRNGYGVQYFSDRQVQSGVWKLGKKYGQFIEEYSEERTYKALVLYFKGQQVGQEIKEIVISQTSQLEFELIYKQRKIIKSKHNISKEQVQQWKAKISSKKTELLLPQQKLIIPLTRESSSKIQKLQLKQIHENNRLTFDQCQANLQYLFHSQSYQSIEPTAVLSIHTSNYIDKLCDISQVHKDNKKHYKDQITHIMLQFRHQYTLFRGVWKHIIIPLSQYDLFKHFSFIRITIRHERLQCVYYDSMPHSKNFQKMKKHYLDIAKNVLINELIKDTRAKIKKMIDEMTLQVFQGFPIQQNSDKNSCGFFILQGIAELMMHGKIIFSSKQLPTIKDRILQKLKQMKGPNDSSFEQSGL